jgi:hypothetical protein
MDSSAFVEMILGDEAPSQRRDCAWLWPLTEGCVWPLAQRMALCEIPWGPQQPFCVPCLTLAAEDGLGRFLCPDHWRMLWTCAGCGSWLPEGRSGYCSPACTTANHSTQTALGRWLGARYL